MGKLTAWTQAEDGLFRAVPDTQEKLDAGLYTTVATMNGFFFRQHDVSDRDILRFPDAPIDRIVSELEDFWTLEPRFTAHGLPHKRGVLMYGPPGSGKTCTVQLVAQDVIERGGIVLAYSSTTQTGYAIIREVEPERPLLILMEDLDSILTPQNESEVLNVLDGIGAMHRVVFLATTNYIEKLPPRISNRPSRFDRKVFIDHPDDGSRKMYLEHMLLEGDHVDVDQWVKDTKGFSLAHLKELLVAVALLGNDYASAVRELKEMGQRKTSADGYAGGQYA